MDPSLSPLNHNCGQFSRSPCCLFIQISDESLHKVVDRYRALKQLFMNHFPPRMRNRS
jgi:hypothetical protein